ncbi:MAG: F0F1 ATP synthase subunit delta [Patescibacteria group bacterium]|nr:F0F1 ATP synthase subunit delta [Patescibacteria group bacterium]
MKDKLAKLLIELDENNPEKTKEIVKTFVSFMEGNEYQLPQILRVVEKKAQEQREKNTLYITLSDEMDIVDKIKQVVGADKDVPIEISIDKSLKGGFIAQYNGKLYNGSISKQLQKIREKISCQ